MVFLEKYHSLNRDPTVTGCLITKHIDLMFAELDINFVLQLEPLYAGFFIPKKTRGIPRQSSLQ
jgi:hypothetical protein